jgi:hypothetical protein
MYKRNALKVPVSVSISEYACSIVPSTATMLELYRVSFGGSTLGSLPAPHNHRTSDQRLGPPYCARRSEAMETSESRK